MYIGGSCLAPDMATTVGVNIEIPSVSAFVKALDDDDEREVGRLLQLPGGFLHGLQDEADSVSTFGPFHFCEWSSHILQRRAKRGGLDLWKFAYAVIKNVGIDPYLWNTHELGYPPASSVWLGCLHQGCDKLCNYTADYCSDARTNAVLFHLLPSACFSLEGLLSARLGIVHQLPCSGDEWVEMADVVGVSRERPRQPRALASAVLENIISSADTLFERVLYEDFAGADARCRALLIVLCAPEVLHANAPASIAALLFKGRPSDFVPALRTDISLLCGHKFDAGVRALQEVITGDTGEESHDHETTLDPSICDAILHATEPASLLALVGQVDEMDDYHRGCVKRGLGKGEWARRVRLLRLLAHDD